MSVIPFSCNITNDIMCIICCAGNHIAAPTTGRDSGGAILKLELEEIPDLGGGKGAQVLNVQRHT